MSNELPTRQEKTLSRRKMLMRLGLVAGAVYAAPVVLQLGEASASSFSGRRGGGKRRSFSRPSRPRRPRGRKPRRSFSR